MRDWCVKQRGCSSSWNKSKKHKAKASESAGASKAGASSSGRATSEEEALRSVGGAPIAAESGDSVPGVARRKIGDSTQRESEEQRGKNNKRAEFAKRAEAKAEERAEES